MQQAQVTFTDANQMPQVLIVISCFFDQFFNHSPFLQCQIIKLLDQWKCTFKQIHKHQQENDTFSM